MNAFTVRRYLAKDIDKVVNLWRKTDFFDGRQTSSLKEHLQWKYNRKFTKIWVAERDKKIIGSCGKIIRPLFLKGYKIITGDWGIDSLVNKRIAMKKINLIFFNVFRKTLLDDYRNKNLAFGFCFPNEVVRDTYLKIGWLNTAVFWHFAKNISYKFSAVKKVYKNFSFNGIDFLQINKFDKGWDNLWKKICKKYTLISLRDSNYLNWRYFKCPEKKYFGFLGKKKNVIKGYIILREEVRDKTNHGYIVDLLVDPDDKHLFSSFILSVLLYFKMKGIDIIHCYTTYMTYKYELLELGFKVVEKPELFVYTYKKYRKIMQEFLNNADNWHITMGDADFDMD